MAYFRCGGNSNSKPEFDFTLLGTGSNSSSDLTITLLHDYNDYEFLQFEYIDSSNDSYKAFALIPVELINKAIPLNTNNYFYVYGYGGSNRAVMSKNTNTEFVYHGSPSGSGYIKDIYGVNLNYKSKTLLYDRGTPANTAVQPVISTIEDYGLLFGYQCDADGLRPFIWPIWNIKDIKGGRFQSGTASIKVMYDSDGTLTSGKYMYIEGYKI